MTQDRPGRDLVPRPDDDAITPILEKPSSVDRFYAGDRAHTLGLTEERSAQIVRQSANARTVSFLAVLIVSFFVVAYWFYEIGIPALGAGSRLDAEADVQYVTDVGRGYALYLANCARCHGQNGQGGVGPPLNDQAKLYNAVLPDGQPGTGHLNPAYIERVLEVGGRYVCGDANSVMPAWLQPAGALNYREVEEIVRFLTASTETEFVYDPAAHGEAAGPAATPRTQTGWRDPNYSPPPGASPPPACWRDPSGVIGGGAASPSAGPVGSPGTADDPRVIRVEETAQLQITDPSGAQLAALAAVPGETVRIEVTNTAGFEHNFFIGTPEQLEANQTAELPGIANFTEGTQSFDWTVPDDIANLEFACTVPGHYQSMHGAVTAAPQP